MYTFMILTVHLLGITKIVSYMVFAQNMLGGTTGHLS